MVVVVVVAKRILQLDLENQEQIIIILQQIIRVHLIILKTQLLNLMSLKRLEDIK